MAKSYFSNYNTRFGNIVCLDKNNNVCAIGEDFMAARDNDLFPVKAYWMIRTSEVIKDKTT